MFKLRETRHHVITIERNPVSGMYTVTVRSGATMMFKASYDTGRAAWAAYRSSAESLMTNAA